jgi:phosphoribosylformylglycinamidine synthase
MAMAGGIGATIGRSPANVPTHGYWFGEDQARYVVTVAAAQLSAVQARARTANVACSEIGTTGGNALVIGDEGSVSVTQLDSRFEGWLPTYMAGSAA